MFSAFKPQKLLHTSHLPANKFIFPYFSLKIPFIFSQNPSKPPSKLPQISNPSLIKLPGFPKKKPNFFEFPLVLNNISQTLPLIDLPQNSLKSSQSNLLNKPRGSLLVVSKQRNHQLLTQNSHPSSLHEKPFNSHESRHKLMMTLMNVQHERIFMKNPKIIENFRAKFPKIQPLGVIPQCNEEKFSASTQATNPVSREAQEALEDLVPTEALVRKTWVFLN